MTGVQLAETIQKNNPQMPIILATGYAEIPAGVGSKLPRLSKPFSQAQLAEAISAVMSPAGNRSS
jgi:FixJ family two-component response regulator